MKSQQISTITKASGKVLIAGGYGVLQHNNLGISLAVDNYFYCICVEFTKNQQTYLSLKSPQIDQQWAYQYVNGNIFEIHQLQNLYVENAIRFTLKYFNKQANAGKIKLILLFDRNFLSENIYQENSSAFTKFKSYGTNYSKTGLGSSACAIVSIVKTLCNIFGQNNLNLINCISQVANLSAQNKIGSNFDISTAVYGSHIYKNILPKHAYQCIKNGDITALRSLDPEILTISNKFKGYGFLVDINKGSNTRIMVSSFLKNLNAKSIQIQQQFYETSKNICLQLLECFQKDNSFMNFREVNKKHRKLQQTYSQITSTPIQPKQLSYLLDKLLTIDSVIYAICPGSGGYDAIFVLSSQNNQQILKEIVKDYGNIRAVNIKWDNDMNISKEEYQQIQSYLVDNFYQQ